MEESDKISPKNDGKSKGLIIGLAAAAAIVAALWLTTFAYYQGASAQISQLQQTLQEMKGNITKYEQEINNYKQEISKYQNQLSQYKQQSTSTQQEIDQYKQKISKYEQEINQYKQKINNYQQIVYLEKSTTLVSNKLINLAPGDSYSANFYVYYAGYGELIISSSQGVYIKVSIEAYNGIVLNYTWSGVSQGTLYFPVLPGVIKIEIVNDHFWVGATVTYTLKYHY